jgi:hypothetical protein
MTTNDTKEDPIVIGILADADDHIDLSVGISQWQMLNGLFVLEEDYRVKGEVWRVHKADADPYPSRPHAHCIDGADRFIGCKLHLGSAELYRGRKSLGRRLDGKQFAQLIGLIQPKFPHIVLPLAV